LRLPEPHHFRDAIPETLSRSAPIGRGQPGGRGRSPRCGAGPWPPWAARRPFTTMPRAKFTSVHLAWRLPQLQESHRRPDARSADEHTRILDLKAAAFALLARALLPRSNVRASFRSNADRSPFLAAAPKAAPQYTQSWKRMWCCIGKRWAACRSSRPMPRTRGQFT
jgi:hypothetical protein